jgi:uncharacterized protein
MTATNDVNQWRTNGWVWMVILIPFTAVLFGILMFTMAGLYPDDLVSDDYYKDGMAINDIILRESRARTLDITVSIELVDSEAVLTTNARDSAIVLTLRHVVDAAKDLQVVLLPKDSTTYAASNRQLEQLLRGEGIWYVEIQGADEDWVVKQRINTPMLTMVVKANE